MWGGGGGGGVLLVVLVVVLMVEEEEEEGLGESTPALVESLARRFVHLPHQLRATCRRQLGWTQAW